MQTPEEMKLLIREFAEDHNYHPIRYRQALYQRTGNPIHAWRAYAMARKLGVAIPDWVLDFFDKWAMTLTDTQYSSAKAMADALALGGPGGRTVSGRARIDERNLEMVERILQLRERPPRSLLESLMKDAGVKHEIVDPGGRTKLDVFAQVAEEFGLSIDRVIAIFSDWTRPPEVS